MAGVLLEDTKEPYVPYLIRRMWYDPVLHLGERTQFTKDGWRQFELASGCLRSSLWRQSQDQVGKLRHGSRSLFEVAIAKIIRTFVHSGDIEGDAKVISCLDSLILGRVLEKESLPYRLLRIVLNHSFSRSGQLNSSDTIVDIDVAILRNERHIRSRASNQDGEFILTLEDLPHVLDCSAITQDGNFISKSRHREDFSSIICYASLTSES